MPGKHTRVLTVEGVRYRWLGRLLHKDRADPGDLYIELAEGPKQKVHARISYSTLKKAYEAVGKGISGEIETIPPYVVRQIILLALAKGWTPDQGGGVLDLGSIDDDIDFSELRSS